MAIDHLTDDMLQEYIDGSPQNREELQAHLADCPQCREHLAEYKKLSGYLAIEPNFELSADFAHTVASAVEEDSTEKILFKLSRAVIWLVGIFACFFSVWYFSDKELIQDNIDKVEGSGQSAFDIREWHFQSGQGGDGRPRSADQGPLRRGRRSAPRALCPDQEDRLDATGIRPGDPKPGKRFP